MSEETGIVAWPRGGGETGALVRGHDWSTTALGPISGWPHSLRTTCDIVLHSARPMWLAWGPSLHFVYNDALAQILGHRHPGMFARPISAVLPERLREIESAMGGAASFNDSLDLWDVCRLADSPTLFAQSLTPVEDDDGQSGGVLGIVSRASERIVAERRHVFLRMLEERLRPLADPKVVMSTAAAMLGRHLGVGRAGYGEVDPTGEWCSISGDWTDGKMASLTGRHRLDDFGPEAMARLRAGTTMILDDAVAMGAMPGAGAAYEAIGIRASIAVPLIKMGRFAAVFYVNQRTARAWRADEEALVQEVAERTWPAVERARAEQAVHRLNDLLGEQVGERTRERDRIWRNSLDLLVVISPDGVFRAVNPAWTSILGYSAADTIGRSFAHFVVPEDLAGTESATRIALDRNTLGAFENRYTHKDGSVRWFSWTVVPEDGNLYGVGRHTTADKEAREELAAANRQLLAQIEEREKVEATLRQMQRLEAVGQLTAGTAHDFNNLLTVVLGNVEFLQRSLPKLGVDTRTMDRLANMKTAALRGAKLTSQLLSFARRQRLDAKPTDLNETVTGMRDLLQTTLGSTMRLEMRLDDRPWPALVDATQIELVLLNLAINARDAMKGGGVLTVETRNVRLTGRVQRPEEPGPGEYVALSVSDTGTGMAPEVLAKAFEPFFTTKEIGKGSGLGLAQVYGFAKQSGGGVGIETKPAAGTTVNVYLPRAGVQTSAETAEAPSPSAPVDMAPDGRTRRILLVDDDTAVREVTATMLSDIGYDVLEAGSGGAALDLLDREADKIDLLLVDFAMPGMNGADVARAARAKYVRLPVLFVTGYADLAAMRGIGESAIVQKPFSNDQLAGKVAVALRGA